MTICIYEKLEPHIIIFLTCVQIIKVKEKWKISLLQNNGIVTPSRPFGGISDEQKRAIGDWFMQRPIVMPLYRPTKNNGN